MYIQVGASRLQRHQICIAICKVNKNFYFKRIYIDIACYVYKVKLDMYNIMWNGKGNACNAFFTTLFMQNVTRWK